jgi:ribulose-5-phosphate 4-epimerase/fuculose-1-phosphate aldolase
MSVSVAELVKRDVVRANRILARENVIDDFGHVSLRNPENPDRYFLARSRSPELVTLDDVMEFTLEGEPIDQRGRPMYSERAIHGCILMARPDINSVSHFHARSVLPFTVCDEPLKPLFHMASVIGEQVPVWDSQPEFGDTDMLVNTLPMGHSLAKAMGQGRAVLIRGHGAVVAGESIRNMVMSSVYLKENAELVLQARALGKPLKYLTAGEVQKTGAMLRSQLASDRAWDYYVARSGFRGV